MRINVISISLEHFKTLRDARGRVWPSLIIYFFVPIGLAAFMFLFETKADRGFYSLSITFFGIFIALILNIQVAIFGIFHRKWNAPSDDILREAQDATLKSRRMLLRQLNVNASYLEVFSCMSLALFLLLFLFDLKGKIVVFVSIFIYAHFLFNLFSLVKRTYILFLGEYDLPEIL